MIIMMAEQLKNILDLIYVLIATRSEGYEQMC